MKKETRKRIMIFSLIAVLAAAGIVFVLLSKKDGSQEKKNIKIGVTMYKINDTFLSGMMDDLTKDANDYEQKTGIKVDLDISGAKDSQRMQNDQVKRYVSYAYDVIVVNPVDRTNISSIIDMASEAGIPLIFFNREPVSVDIFRENDIYYVGSDAKMTAVMEGEIVADAYKKNPRSIDLNGDGIINYVMLEGEMGHQDAIIRTEWSTQTLIDNGLKINRLDSKTANWERSQAAVLMEQWLDDFGSDIELVLCNNDDMALGAADTLQTHQIQNIAVVGIDATAQGLAAVKDGRMLGTVDANAKGQAEAIFKLASGLALNGKPPQDLVMDAGRYVRADLIKITRDTLPDEEDKQ